MGLPKALLCDDAGVPYLDRAIGALFEGGCAEVRVVLGAAADQAVELLHAQGWDVCEDVSILTHEGWSEGMGTSLRAGLAGVEGDVVVTLVDLPDVTDDVVRRFVALATSTALARATYDGRPGHPVLVGREHLAGLAATLTGDEGGRRYLDDHGVAAVPCEDLASGRDLDTPEDLRTTLDR